MLNKVDEVERKLTRTLEAEMRALESRLKNDPESDPLIWPIRNQLAATRRPLRDHPDFKDYIYKDHLPAHAGPLIIAWVERILVAGVRSVICLLPDEQLRRYLGLRGMPDGLLALYESLGLEVRHVACPDPRHEKVVKGWLERVKPPVYQAFLELKKPVLLHCSAGIDRSSPVASYLASRTEGYSPTPSQSA